MELVMKNRYFFFLFLFSALFLTGCSVAGHEMTTQTDFWRVHSVWFLIFMNLFPRITMLVATPFPIGFGGWFGWLVVPRIYAAIIATTLYWNTNPTLCVITWIIALGTTSTNEGVLIRKIRDR